MGENGEILETEQTVTGQESEEKVTVVGVRFRPCGKIYTFDASDLDVGPGSKVVVDSEMGLSLGSVVTPRYEMLKGGTARKKLVRLATEEDFQKVEENKKFREEARAYCIERAAALKLPMKVVDTETSLDRKKIIFYFTADGRIDFRELVRELAAKFRTRIEMRQIGVRDEVKLLGGIGACGRETCCTQFLTSFAPITIKMAKQQSLSINQSKLSGICGRLMCCLSYEYREYVDEQKEKTEAVTEGAGDAIAGDSVTDAVEESLPDTAVTPPESAESVSEEPVTGAGEVSETDIKEIKKRRRRRRKGRGAARQSDNESAGRPESPREAEPPSSGAADKQDGTARKRRHHGKRRRSRRKKK